jgi:hypothetical protein
VGSIERTRAAGSAHAQRITNMSTEETKTKLSMGYLTPPREENMIIKT